MTNIDLLIENVIESYLEEEVMPINEFTFPIEKRKEAKRKEIEKEFKPKLKHHHQKAEDDDAKKEAKRKEIENEFKHKLNPHLQKTKEEDGDDDDTKKDSHKKKKKKFRAKAIKHVGGTRTDFDTEDDETYNQETNDEEQGNIEDLLDNGYVNVAKVAQELYPDHTPQGAQSQLRKKLKKEKSDSGKTYKIKSKEMKKLRHIISQHLS